MKKTNKKPAKRKKQMAVFASPLKKGDTIGLVAPAGSLINKDFFTAGVEILEKKGFKVKFNRKLLNTKGYLAGSDQERADEFNRLWSDTEVKALVAARGGYGSLRMIDLIDLKQIRKNPKILIGFSDLTVLLNTIHKETGLVTYHGPVVTTLSSINRISQKIFFDTLLSNPPKHLAPRGLKILHPGNTKGILMGGNLTTMVHMIDTPHEISWNNTILFLEDIGESPYRLDRLITHLYLAKRLGKIKGLILGTFTDDDRKERSVLMKAVYNRISELLADKNIPIWANFPVGHSRKNLTLPIGGKVEMDSSENMLKFL